MTSSIKAAYSPKLRLKDGELAGVRLLATDVAYRTLPHFVVMPKSECDATSPPLFAIDDYPDVSACLAAHWQERPVLIDLTYVIDEYGRERLNDWLPVLFQRARDRYVRAIPAVMLSDLDESSAVGFRNAIDYRELIKLALCIPFTDIDRTENSKLLEKAFDWLGVDPKDCAAIVDFGGGEFTNVSVVAPIIDNSLEMLQELGPWRQVIFQGTHYPEVNPAKKSGELVIQPRNEWLSWKEAVNFNPQTAEYMMFGDYAADCAKISFDKSGGRAIRHLRWATSNSWRIQRAVDSGSDTCRMRGVYRAIVESSDFAGANFSDADAYIAHALMNNTAKTGNSTTWRQLNTTHHITQVIADITQVRGEELTSTKKSGKVQQLTLSNIR